MPDAEEVLEHEEVGGVHVLRLRLSRLEDVSALLLFENAMGEILEAEEGAGPRVIVNLASLDYMVTTALAVLMSFRTKLMAAGGRLRLCCPRPNVAEVFRITHFDEYFEISPTEREALRYMGRGR